jgi:hypothetical protein
LSEADRGIGQLSRSQAISARTGVSVGKWLVAPPTAAPWLPGGWANSVRIEGTAGQPVHQVLQDRTTLFGLAGKTGRPRWRCDIPECEGDNGAPHAFTLVLDDRIESLPRLVFPCARPDHRTGQPRDHWAVVAREALPAGPDGRYLLPKGQPREYGELPEDPRWVRPLPWVQPWSSIASQHLAAWLRCGAFVTLVLYGFVRRRWWLLVGFLVLFVLGTALAAMVSFWPIYTVPLLPMQRYSSRGWYQLGLDGVFHAGLPSLVLFVGGWLRKKVADRWPRPARER